MTAMTAKPAAYCSKSLPLAAALALFLSAAAAGAGSSALWKAGASGKPQSRLPDFSFAGYRGGLRPLPRYAVKADVRDYGAAGDGRTDDTAAFAAALESVDNGAVLVPPGRYRITRPLKIGRSGVVLRGEGPEKSVLVFPLPLAGSVGPAKKHAPGGSWSWSGGCILFAGELKQLRLAQVAAPARRGETALVLSSGENVMPGQWVRLVMANTGGSLARWLYDGKSDEVRESFDRRIVDFAAPVAAIEGDRITLGRPLRADVRPEWKPEVWAFSSTVQDSGIEDLSLEFPAEPYVGHHIEPGFNAVSFEAVSSCWARNIRIYNADSGVFLRGRSRFCTIESVTMTANRRRLRTGYGSDRGEPQHTPVGGHHGILIADAYDNLVSDCVFEFRFIHDLGVSAWAAGNVFSGIRGIDLSFDHHRRGPYENLFTEIDAGEGNRLWESGGDDEDGPHSGVRETFWNIRADRAQKMPSWANQGIFVGITTDLPSRTEGSEWWEAIPPERLQPANLYQAQRDERHIGVAGK